MAMEYVGKGITINAVSPGYIDTDIVDMLGECVDTGTEYVDSENGNIDTNSNTKNIEKLGIPMGRLGKPDEVAHLVEFLALNPAGNYITGQNYVIDGGMSLGKI